MRAFHILDFSRGEGLGWNIFMDVERPTVSCEGPALYEAISNEPASVCAQEPWILGIIAVTTLWFTNTIREETGKEG